MSVMNVLIINNEVVGVVGKIGSGGFTVFDFVKNDKFNTYEMYFTMLGDTETFDLSYDDVGILSEKFYRENTVEIQYDGVRYGIRPSDYGFMNLGTDGKLRIRGKLRQPTGNVD